MYHIMCNHCQAKSGTIALIPDLLAMWLCFLVTMGACAIIWTREHQGLVVRKLYIGCFQTDGFISRGLANLWII
jgi:hypothetical protein